MLRSVLTVVTVMLAMSIQPLAQGRPNFSGDWVLFRPAPVGGGGRGGGGAPFGLEFTAKQDANTLTIIRMLGDQTVTATYRLDGSESTNMVAGRGGQQMQVSKAVWEANKLAITTTVNFGVNTVEQKRLLSLEGGNLVIEQTNPGRQGGAPTAAMFYYRRPGATSQDPCTVNPNLPVCK